MSEPTGASLRASGRRRVITALALSTFFTWLGGGALVPLLPLYLRGKGASDTLIGIAMGAFFGAGVLVQYPLGRLSDRIGRRPLFFGGLGAVALADLLFALGSGPVGAVALRALQGAGSGAVTVAAAATVAVAVEPERRGRGYGAIYGSQTAGLAVGPLFGSIVGSSSMRPVFLAALVAVIFAALPIARVVPPRRHPLEPARRDEVRLRLTGDRLVRGILVVAVVEGLIAGMYEVCWSLLLHQRGAVAWQIGLSWTLYALPFAALSVPAGWLADHADRRVLAGVAVLAGAGFAVSYPFLHSVALLVGLGAAEAVAVAVTFPAVLSMLSLRVPGHDIGRAQGLVATAQTAAMAVAAVVSGSLFALWSALPFVAAGGSAILGAASLPYFWRHRPPGPARRVGDPDGSAVSLPPRVSAAWPSGGAGAAVASRRAPTGVASAGGDSGIVTSARP